jgi:hypothetical protein
MKYLKAIYNWLKYTANLKMIIKGIKIALDLYGHFSDDKKKIEKIKKQLLKVQSVIDNSQALMNNEDTVRLLNKINSDNASSRWGNIEASYVKNKHGLNNDGIDLKYRTTIDGKDVEIQWDPKSGQKGIKLGMFKVNFK